MTNQQESQVDLSFETHWCAKHLEPFKAKWPEGAPLAMIKLFEAVTNDPRFFDALPKDADGKASQKAVQAMLSEFSPLCCFVGSEVMESIYGHAGVKQYQFAEAFHVMKYRCAAGHEEMIWNSRDGVTPFNCRCFLQACPFDMHHVDWQLDAFDPAHKPEPGDRIFVDMSKAEARALGLDTSRGRKHPKLIVVAS